MNNYTIRAYNTSDKQLLLDLLNTLTPTYFAVEEYHDFDQYLDTETELYYVLEMNRKIVACGGINFEKENKLAKISWDMVSSDFQGQGIGSVLLQYRLDIIKQLPGIEQLIVRTSQFAYQFYEKHGFDTIETKENYWAEGIHMYKMAYQEKQLSPFDK